MPTLTEAEAEQAEHEQLTLGQLAVLDAEDHTAEYVPQPGDHAAARAQATAGTLAWLQARIEGPEAS